MRAAARRTPFKGRNRTCGSPQ